MSKLISKSIVYLTIILFCVINTPLKSQVKSINFNSTSYSFPQQVSRQVKSLTSIDDFFKYYGVKLLAGLAHPTNIFSYGLYEISDSYVTIHIYYKEGYITKLRVKREGLFFTQIIVDSDNDWVSPFAAIGAIKDLLLELSKDEEDEKVKSNFEKKIAKKIAEMTGKEMACLALTIDFFNH